MTPWKQGERDMWDAVSDSVWVSVGVSVWDFTYYDMEEMP